MKTKYLLFGSVLLFACGCNSTGGLSNTGAGALAGGGIGAVAGALIGGATHNAAAGAAIGGAAGAGIGALAGNSADKAEQKAEQQKAQAIAAAQRPQVSVVDVINMVHNHIEDGIIIQQIRESGSNFRLTPDDTIMLRQQGVSEAVIQEMLRPHVMMVPGQPVIVQPGGPPVAVGVEYVRPYYGGYYRRGYY